MKGPGAMGWPIADGARVRKESGQEERFKFLRPSTPWRAPVAAAGLFMDSYCIATVASAREDAPPMVTTSGTALPVGALAGISTLI